MGFSRNVFLNIQNLINLAAVRSSFVIIFFSFLSSFKCEDIQKVLFFRIRAQNCSSKFVFNFKLVIVTFIFISEDIKKIRKVIFEKPHNPVSQRTKISKFVQPRNKNRSMTDHNLAYPLTFLRNIRKMQFFFNAIYYYFEF